jgi:serine/threonine protein kinase
MNRAGGKLPLEVALIIAGDVAHALDHAHSALDAQGLPLGIVHRDVKPSNVLVSWGGDVKLTDFGIALATERSTRTEAGMVPGTMGFIAPEQRAKSEVDGRADVFALGLTLHALITGYTPLRDIEVELAVLEGSPIPLDPVLPKDVRELIAAAVAPRRLDRPSARKLADSIGSALAPRLSRDPRSHLLAFLAPLDEHKPKPGALDALLGLDVVLAEEAASDEPPKYELRPTAMGRPSHIATAPSTRTSKRRWPLAIVATAALAGGGVAVIMAMQSQPPQPQPLPQPLPQPQPQPQPLPQPLPQPQPSPPTPTPTAHNRHHFSPPPSRDAGLPAAPTEYGYLQITGDANVGAEVLVDGAHAGYVPNALRVAVGKHRVEIVRQDGTRQTWGSIDVTDYNTLAHPARR